MPLPIATITTAGIAEVTSAHIAGLKVELSKISIGNGTWSNPPPASTTALVNELQRFDINSYESDGTSSVSVAGSIYSEAEFFVTEVGIWAKPPGSNTVSVLFAVAARSTPPLLYKSSFVPDLVVQLSLSLAALPISAIVVNANTTPMELVLSRSLLEINTVMTNEGAARLSDAYRLKLIDRKLRRI